MNKIRVAEYIWLDGAKPTAQVRSKSRIVNVTDDPKISDFPEWAFDGSSTYQAEGGDSDCILIPVNYVLDPIDDGGDFLVLCEVLNPDGSFTETNTRARLRAVLDNGGDKKDPWFGFEQEYTMFSRNTPLGWPEHGFPAKQGPYYCGVGGSQIFGRALANQHRKACIDAGLLYYGMNAEVMPGQWEYQIGYRGIKTEDAGALNVADHMWIARWLMHRLSEQYHIHISHDQKPIKGDWNGAGMHTNFSTKDTRDPGIGRKTMEQYIKKLRDNHKNHVNDYGDKLEERLTGRHETSSIHEFSWGDANRGSSIRVPRPVAINGHGYIEDRRPGANADPYTVAALLVATICGITLP